MKKLLGMLLSMIFVTGLLSVAFTAALSAEIDNNIDSLVQSIDDISMLEPSRHASPNPYDYVQGNASFKNLVALGPDALPIIENKINSSKDDGLKEYLLAIAAEEIARVNLKDSSGTIQPWSTGKEWAKAWRKHLHDVPDKVASVADSDQIAEAKTAELVKLGTPAIPFIFDRVEKGSLELTPALNALMRDGATVSTMAPVKDHQQFAKAHKAQIDTLRAIVNEARE